LKVLENVFEKKKNSAHGQCICPWHGQFCFRSEGVPTRKQLLQRNAKVTIKLVGFKGAQQAKIKELMERKQAVVLNDCQIKKAKRGSNMEVILKRTNAIGPSPKKFKVDLKEDEVTLLEELQNKEEYERVCVQVKVLEVMDPTTVSSGKKVRDVTMANSTAFARCTLWKADIGQLEKRKNYDLKTFLIREF